MQCKIYKPVEAQDAGELLILMQFMKSKIAQQMAAISQGPSAPWADKSDDGPRPGFSISSFLQLFQGEDLTIHRLPLPLPH